MAYDRVKAAESLIKHLESPGRRPLTRDETELLFELHLEGKELSSDPTAVVELLRSEAQSADGR